MEQILIKTILVVCGLSTTADLDDSRKANCFNSILNCSLRVGVETDEARIKTCVEQYRGVK